MPVLALLLKSCTAGAAPPLSAGGADAVGCCSTYVCCGCHDTDVSDAWCRIGDCMGCWQLPLLSLHAPVRTQPVS